jgi:chromosome segregation protein
LRLTHIKLAGFKSFVDPTTIGTPGHLVGIVGPNGCGKSNVIDAVRWVLGESRASALRGESMQDVIFNGAGERKPVGRASVELIFDNSLGRIGGQWGQFTELSIKRVLQRDGDSAYYINNVGVRRRDIQDLFLGTGLGPRAYAIIEQGMISRIIEAKPEELRVFLEEAAGVSKYKERRRETEGRLADARENLLRVEDIRAELEQQRARLEAQARIATEYRGYEVQLREAQHLLWFSRQQDAARQRQRHAADLASQVAVLEGLQARSREQELAIEGHRAAHMQAGDTLHEAQGLYYEAGAEVTRLEQQLQFQRESEARLRQQAVQVSARLGELDAAAGRIEQERQAQAVALDAAAADRETRAGAERAAAAALPGHDEAVRRAAQTFSEAQSAAAAAEQALRLAEAKRDHLERMLGQLAQREEKLRAEERDLGAPATSQIADLEATSEREKSELRLREARIDERRREVAALEGRQSEGRELARGRQQRQTEVEARIEALAALQSRLGRSTEVATWLEGRGLAETTRLWQEIGIAAGWEDALEAVLRERLDAIHLGDLDPVAAWPEPPGRVVLYSGEGGDPVESPPDSLVARLDVRDDRLRCTLTGWLHGVRCADSLADALGRRHTLGAAEAFVTPRGQLVTADSLTTFAPDAELHGVLARQRELGELESIRLGAVVASEQALAALAATERAYAEARAGLEAEVASAASQQRRCHDVELELLQLRKAAEAASRRRQAIADELVEVARQRAAEEVGRRSAEEEIGAARTALGELLHRREALRHERNESEVALVRAREELRTAERAAQEALYAERSARDRLAELDRRLASTVAQRDEARAELAILEGDQAKIDWTPIESALQHQLAARAAREEALAAARTRLDGLAATLRGAEEERIRVEQELEPARARIEELRLREQAAAIQEQQFSQQLAEAEAAVAELPERLRAWGRASTLPAEIDRLQKAIAALGAVNLAALDELQAASERKAYLDHQAADLMEAITTLENAIRRIDRETRELLQSTFDRVNEQFGRLFPTLFGGGAARLVLTGEEILDAGIQVIAQPPGKRNTSIHLLSGGEKALSAISLVFALFQLNPAPFCLLDEVDAPLDEPNTERFCRMVREMSAITQFLYISHNKITMEMASQLIGITMPEAGVSRVVAVDIGEAIELARRAA